MSRANAAAAAGFRRRIDVPGLLRERTRLMAMCVAIVRDQRVAEEIVQEAIVRGLDDGIRFARSSAWLTTVARHLCVDYFRNRARLFGSDVLIDREDHDATAALERVLDRSDLGTRREALARAMRALDDEDVLLLWLRDVEGWNYDEIAQLQECCPSTLRSRANRTRRKLRLRIAASVGNAIGVGAAVLGLRGTRRALEHARAISQRALAAAGVSTTLALGSLMLPNVTPWPAIFMPVHEAPSMAVISIGESVAGAHERGEPPGIAGVVARAPSPTDTGLVALDFENEHRSEETIIPQKSRLAVEIKDSDGNSVWGFEASRGCEHTHQDLPRVTDNVVVSC